MKNLINMPAQTGLKKLHLVKKTPLKTGINQNLIKSHTYYYYY